MAARKQRSTSRDQEAFARRTVAARETRERAAAQVAATIADQVYDLIVDGDLMGGRTLLARRIEQVIAAEKADDRMALRAALMEGAVAFGSWIAAMDFEQPSELGSAA